MYMIDSLLLTAVHIDTRQQNRKLTNATGFFFSRDQRLFLVSNRHVMADDESKHHPDTIELGLHIDEANMASATGYSIPLYDSAGNRHWRQGQDRGGEVDVAVIEIDSRAFPTNTVYRAFTPQHLADPARRIDIGTNLTVIGFPLGFHDTLHHMPVARHAILASSYGLRFQGEGYFLTDARTHRGTSGAPVVMRIDDATMNGDLPWLLLGVHSARLDVTRDLELDEALGLNCAWYADILMTLTED